MNTVINHINTIIVKNSKFICLIYNISSILEVDKCLKNVKATYKDATHYCYGYIFNEIKKESDDGEPSGTAGIPILQVLEKNNLNMVLCVVVRYFGGIKLGSGGLVRAYTKSVVECLKGHIKVLTLGYHITITFEYKYVKQVDYILQNSIILNKEFNDNVTYHLNTTKDIIDKLKNINHIVLVINEEVYM